MTSTFLTNSLNDTARDEKVIFCPDVLKKTDSKSKKVCEGVALKAPKSHTTWKSEAETVHLMLFHGPQADGA